MSWIMRAKFEYMVSYIPAIVEKLWGQSLSVDCIVSVIKMITIEYA